jgi:capsular exopolysaccharide synthesis family protein
LTTHDLIAIARRRIWVVVLCAAVAAGAAFLVSESKTKKYTAGATLLFEDPGFDQKLFGSTFLQPAVDQTREAATNLRLVTLRVVAQRTAEKYGRGLTAGQVQQMVNVGEEGDSNLVAISVTDTSPTRAAAVANLFGEQYIEFRRDADQRKIKEAEQLISRQLRTASTDPRETATLRERANQLQILASLQTGKAELVERAVPPSVASSPHPTRNAVVGGVLGLLLGLGLAFLLERMDRRLREADEIADIFGRPILGAIPESGVLAGSSGPTASLTDARPEAEAFQMLRANLRYFYVNQPVRSLLVTSSAPGDGKSTVAWHLASAAAAAGTRVLLLEVDLRRPTFANASNLSRGPGLSQVLAQQVPMAEAIQKARIHAAFGDFDQDRTLDVLVAGDVPPNPVDLIGSERMGELLNQAEETYDLVVIDSPPLSLVSDVIPLTQRVSGVIVVCQLGRTTRDAIARLRDQLGNLDAFTFGIVINAVKRSDDSYGYGYGYEAYAPSPSPPAANGDGVSDGNAGNGDLERDKSPIEPSRIPR